MTSLRPETRAASGPAISDDTALFLIRKSVARRRSLIFGRLHDEKGGHCALGAFWNDNSSAVLNSSLIEEVASVNDSVPATASAHERWKLVNSWLRWKLRVLATGRGDPFTYPQTLPPKRGKK